MPGRNARPAELHVLMGNPNRRTKTELAARKAAEVKIGTSELVCPTYVKADMVAFARWTEVVAEYKRAGVEFVTSSDVGHLARACQMHSQYIDLVRRRALLCDVDESVFTVADENRFHESAGEQVGDKAAARLWERVEYLLSLNGVLTLDKAINAKVTLLNALEDRLFLNPLSKVKNVPKQVKKEMPPEGEQEMFG